MSYKPTSLPPQRQQQPPPQKQRLIIANHPIIHPSVLTGCGTSQKFNYETTACGVYINATPTEGVGSAYLITSRDLTGTKPLTYVHVGSATQQMMNTKAAFNTHMHTNKYNNIYTYKIAEHASSSYSSYSSPTSNDLMDHRIEFDRLGLTDWTQEMQSGATKDEYEAFVTDVKTSIYNMDNVGVGVDVGGTDDNIVIRAFRKL